jgi:hypothetical protein
MAGSKPVVEYRKADTLHATPFSQDFTMPGANGKPRQMRISSGNYDPADKYLLPYFVPQSPNLIVLPIIVRSSHDD